MALTRSQISVVDVNDGQQGESGHSYILDIVGGPRSITYDEFGNPPSVSFNFSAELYVDGVLVTPSSYSWSTEGALSGSGTGSTFVPTLNTVADVSTLPGTSVKLLVIFDGVTIKRSEPLAIAQIGETGEKGDIGLRGPQGIEGPIGPQGQTTYTWIKYADTPTSGINNLPDGKKYIGIAHNKITATESSSYGDYTWSLIKGTDGLPGSDGANGVTTYTWVKYADTDTGSGMDDSPVGKRYIGLAFNKTTATKSSTASHYSWSPLYDNVKVGGRNYWVVSESREHHARTWAAGAFNESANAVSSGLIPTEPNEQFVVNYPSYSSQSMYYNKSREYIGSFGALRMVTPSSGVNYTYTNSSGRPTDDIPAYVSYTFRSTFMEDNPDYRIMLEKGNISTDWTPAPEDVTAKINADVAAARVYAETKATEAQNAAEGVAVAQATLAETNSKAYADGIVSDEETARIAEAEDVLTAAQGYADARAIDEAQAAKDYIDTVNAALAAQLGTEIDGLQVAWTYDTVAPFIPFDNMIWVDTTLVPNVPKRWVATANMWIPLSVSSLEDIGAYAASEGEALATNFATFKQSFDSGEYITQVIDSAAFEDVLSGKFDKAEFATEFAQNAESITASVATVKATADGAAQNYETITNYMDFSKGGLLLGESGSALQVNITNEELQFLNANNKIAYINGSDMFITKANITEKIKIGVHELEKHDANITILRWVGEDN